MALVGIAPPSRLRGLADQTTQRQFDAFYEWILRLRGFLGALFGTTISVSLTGNTHDLAPEALADASYIRLSASAAVNLTGVSSQTAGFIRKTLINVGSFNITLTHQDTGSAAGNRFMIPGGISLTMLPADSCDIWYDSVSLTWRPI